MKNNWEYGIFMCRYSLIIQRAEFQFGIDDIHRIRKELECLLKKLQELFQEYKGINCDSKLEMRLDYDKEIEIENRKHYTLKDTPTNIR